MDDLAHAAMQGVDAVLSSRWFGVGCGIAVVLGFWLLGLFA